MMFYQSNKAWLTAALATLMVVAVDQLARQLDAAAWTSMAPAWLLQTALMVGTFSTGLGAYLTDTLAARIVCVVGAVGFVLALAVKLFC